MSKRMTQIAFADHYGLEISVGTVSNAEQIVSDALLRRYEINAVVYSSTPSRRWALINMNRYREGDTLSGRAV